MFYFFFFSSRRRHTRCSRDWSSDVCSSDLEAEAARELARLMQAMGRNQDALTLLNTAHRLFGRLDARVDLVHVGGKVSELETTYFDVVREWGQSIESADSYTFGHCERVAQSALAIARDRKSTRLNSSHGYISYA